MDDGTRTWLDALPQPVRLANHRAQVIAAIADHIQELFTEEGEAWAEARPRRPGHPHASHGAHG